jgi:hypothetical protein
MNQDELRERRLAENEALARDVNERVGDVGESWYGPDETLEFICECSRDDCSSRVHLTMEDYRRVRSAVPWFVLVRDHIEPELEREVAPIRDVVIVEKIGVGREVAEETAQERPPEA